MCSSNLIVHPLSAPENGGSLKAHAANLKPLLSAHGNGYECEHDSECPATFTCNSYGVCEGGGSHNSMSRSGSGSGSRGSHRSGSSSRRSGSKSSSRRSGSGSGSRSYDGHGSELTKHALSKLKPYHIVADDAIIESEAQGSNGNKPCTSNADCDAPEVCNDEGHCFVGMLLILHFVVFGYCSH